MTEDVRLLLLGYYSEDMIDDRPQMRTSLYNGGSERVERVRAGFDELMRNRDVGHEDFNEATWALFESDEDLYRDLEEAYRFFFDGEPPHRTAT